MPPEASTDAPAPGVVVPTPVVDDAATHAAKEPESPDAPEAEAPSVEEIFERPDDVHMDEAGDQQAGDSTDSADGDAAADTAGGDDAEK